MSAFCRAGFLVWAAVVLTWALPAPAQDKEKDKKEPTAPVVNIKPLPESIDDLRNMEKQVQAVLDKVMKCTVGVQVGPGQGSGVIVSADGIVLTAGHVSLTPGQNCFIVLPDGKRLRAKTLGRNGGIDSGMVKIIDEGPFPFVDMGKSVELKPGQWCIAVGHPGGFRANRQPVVRVGRILVANNSFLRTDATLVGGDSGGPLFDMNGKVIGIHSRIAKSITENVHVPIDTYRQTWDRLAKGESWGGNLGQPSLVQAAGGKVIFEEKGQINATDPRDAKMTDSYHKMYSLKLAPGNAYTFDMISKAKGTEFDPFLRLEDSTGKQLADNDDGGGQLNSRIVYRPSRADTYRIYATTFEAGQTGPFTLTVREAEIVAKDFPAGKVDILLALKVPRPVAPQLFGQFSKAGVGMYANALVVDNDGKPQADRDVTFRWKNGNVTQKTNDQGQTRLQLTPQKIDGLVLELAEGQRAQVQITDEEGNVPPIKLNLDKAKVPSAGGKVVLKKEGKLQLTDPKDKLLNGSHHQMFDFKMTAGNTYTLDLESNDFDAFLRLEDAKGKSIASDDDSGGYLNSRIVYKAAQDEDYRIVVTSFQGGQVGSFTLTIREAEKK